MTETEETIEPPTVLRVYAYGARTPTQGLELIREQMALSHKFTNKLIELERKRLERNDQAWAQDPVIAGLLNELRVTQEAFDAARKAIDDRRREARSARVEVGDIEAEIAGLKTRRTDLYRQISARRKEVKRQVPKITEDLRAVVQTYKAEVKQAYNEPLGLYWCTRLARVAAQDAALEARLKPKPGRPVSGPPRFRQWRRDGRNESTIGLQLQGGLSWQDALGGKNRQLRIRMDRGGKTTKASEHYALVAFRVNSTETGGPVWSEVPVYLHRALPPEALIKEARLLVRYTAKVERWFLHLVVDETMCPKAHDPGVRAQRGRVGIDVGWRWIEDQGLRVAVAHDDQGQTRELVIPAKMIEAYEHAEGLQALRDKMLDGIKAQLKEWLAGTELEEKGHVHKWRDPWRVQKLLKDHGALMPEDLRGQVVYYLGQSDHLWTWKEHEQRKFRNRRLKLYQQWAAGVARDYCHVTLEELDLRDFAKRPEAEEGTRTNALRYQKLRGLGAVSELRSWVKRAAEARGAVVCEVDPANTTRQCGHCGHVDDGLKAARAVVVECPKCLVSEDQDLRAARNLLDLGALAVPKTVIKVSGRQARWRKGKEVKKAQAEAQV